VVSIGTSLPELFVSLEAALGGSGSLALGNVVGSNVSNLALILGAAALARPIVVCARVVWVELPILVVVSIVFVGFILDGRLGRLDGVLLTSGIGAYILYTLHAAETLPPEVESEFNDGIPKRHAVWVDVALVLCGIGGLVGGAHLLVTGAVAVAKNLGVGPIIIGLTVIAVGTSLPELATSVVAARRGQGDIAVGNAVGSSIFNILAILGITVLVHPLSTRNLGWAETATMLGISVFVVLLLRTGWTLSRREGAVLVACYLGYLTYVLV